MTCDLCIRRVHHYPKDCSEPCIEGRSHQDDDIFEDSRDYGYWMGRCRKCGLIWQVDSSG